MKFSILVVLVLYVNSLEMNQTVDRINKIYRQVSGKKEDLFQFIDLIYSDEGEQVLLLNNTMQSEIAMHYIVMTLNNDNETSLDSHISPSFEDSETDLTEISKAIFMQFDVQEIQYSILKPPKRQTIKIPRDSKNQEMRLINCIILHKNSTFSVNVLLESETNKRFYN